MEEPKLVSALEKYRSKEPWPDTPASPLPEEICECDGLEPPCDRCGYCTACDTRIKGNLYDRHTWRHTVHSERREAKEYQRLVQEREKRDQLKEQSRQPAPVKEQESEPEQAESLFDMLEDL